MRKIAVIGGGWYGCHIATQLLHFGHDVTLYEASQLLSGSSRKNQNRLHLGFHYPRSSVTRADVLRNFNKFKNVYGFCCRPVSPNIYAVASVGSLLDFPSYLQLVGGSPVDPAVYNLQNVEGAVLTGEEYICQSLASQWFLKALDGRVRYERAGALTGYDFTIDCTYGERGLPTGMFYEACVILRYAGTGPGITIMDGEFPSYYPCDGGGTLSHAGLTPVFRSASYPEIQYFMKHYVLNNQKEFEDQMLHFWPGFSRMVYVGHTLSVKVKETGSSGDARKCYVGLSDRHAQVICGKISNVFDAFDHVKEWICSH